MNTGIRILKNNKLFLRIGAILNAVFYALGIALFVYPFTTSITVILVFSLSLLALVLLIKPWKIDEHTVASIMNYKFDKLEFSTELLIKNRSTFNLIEKLQYDKLLKLFNKEGLFKLPFSVKNSVVFLLTMVILGNLLNLAFKEAEERSQTIIEQQKNNGSILETVIEKDTVAIKNIVVLTNPPSYTGFRNETFELENIEVREGSIVSWSVDVTENIDSVLLDVTGVGVFKMDSGPKFTQSLNLSKNGFYSLNLYREDSLALSTNLFAINVIVDESPKVAIENQPSFMELDYDDSREVSFKINATDDYGISDAYIIATVTKGSGESVKFREERLEVFETTLGKSLNTNKTINLDKLKMNQGDELYFYLEAIDNKPSPQKSRTDTYFVSIKDTTDVEFSIAGSFGVDIMPTYFRSQRQIIIDTEKLIKNRPKLEKSAFNSKSNGLAHDQKTLRLKYGQFMGLEDESGIAIEVEIPDEMGENGELLDEYTHDHDGDNEHNLVEKEHDHDHENEGGEKSEESPLESYMHNHDNPEEATLYTRSTRSMLKEALSHMWDSELYLRLNQPQKSLPYQFKSLELIKKIKNQARIYVHRIGFDPPPIKLDKRLTGDIDEVESFYQMEKYSPDEELLLLKEAIDQLSKQQNGSRINQKDLIRLLRDVKGVIALKAVDQPLKYLTTLDLLKSAVDSNQLLSPDEMNILINKLYKALPEKTYISSPVVSANDSLSQLFLNRLSTK